MQKKKVAKVPIILQMESLECGAASLSMVLAYFGKWVPLEQVRSDCGVSRDGSSAKNILKAARNYGLAAKGYKCDLQTVKKAEFPVIIHWNFNHFVVLNGFHKNKALINDPARGYVKVSMEEFDESFTGIILQFSKTDQFVADGKPKNILDFAKKRCKGTGIAFLFVIFTGLITALISMVQPVFSRVFIDRILTGENPDWLYPVMGCFSFIIIIQIIVTFIHSVYMLKIEGKLAIVANTSFMWHVLRLPMEFFSQRMVGDIAARQSSNEGIAAALIQKIAPILLNMGMLVFFLFIMLSYSPTLTLIALSAVLLNMITAQLIAGKRLNITRVMMRDEGKLAGATVSGIEMIETIKASGSENGYFEKWAGYQAAVNSGKVSYAKVNQYLGSIPLFLQQLASILVLTAGTGLILSGQLSVGMLLAFQGFMSSFLSPVNDLMEELQGIQEMKSSIDRIEDVMCYETDRKDVDSEVTEDEEFSKLTGNIEMKNITFGYSKLGEPLIENFNMQITPGKRIAFVGSSGCGKSTLAKLLSGLYQPWSGEILFDGKPMQEIRREVFTGSLAVVDQDIILFEDTIANNIKMWDETIEDFEMILAARDAVIHNDIVQREGGFHCQVLEGGKNFSGGQRQRFEIARVLAQDPTVVILDEATSALDAKTEYEVVKAIKDRGITLIIIAHRLSTIRDCDEIIVLDKGIVMERGTHEELYGAGGLYAQLIATE